MLDTLALDDDRLALLVQHGGKTTRVIVLDGIAPTIWAATAEPTMLATIAEAAVALKQSGIAIVDFAVRRPSLDDVFLTLTGQTGDSAVQAGTPQRSMA